MKIILIVLTFLFIGALFIISNNNLALNDPEKMKEFQERYYSWASQLFDNSKSIVGYVAKSEWLPSEEQEKIIMGK